MSPNNFHSFDATQAQDYGISAALVLKFLAHKVQKSHNKRDGLKWYYDSALAIATRFPYLAATTVSKALKDLENAGAIVVGNYNRRKRDRTRWYHVAAEHRKQAEAKTIRFDSDIAAHHGVAAAVLYYNLDHHISQARANGRRPQHVMSPNELNANLPFLSLATIKRALQRLTKSGLAERVPGHRGAFKLPAGTPTN